jgi:hypothetical protein
MKSKLLSRFAAAVSAIVLNVALVTPALAEVKAALTRDVDRATAQPVHSACTTQSQVVPCTLYTVPAGKRLIVETVSYYVTAFDVNAIVTEICFGKDCGVSVSLAQQSYDVAVVQNPRGLDRFSYAATQPLRAYFEEAEVFGALYSAGHYNSIGTFRFSGYLVDK